MTRNKSQPIYQQVANALRDDIIRGRLKAGTRLKIPELSERYSISSIPVREAVQLLSGEGLVTVSPNRGAIVRQVDADYVSEMFDVRKVLEEFVADSFTTVCTEKDLDRLQSIQTEIERFEDLADPVGRAKIDYQFHSLLYDVVGNSEVKAICARQDRILTTALSVYGQSISRRLELRAEHRELIDAFRRSDRKAARLAAREHFGNTQKEVSALMRRQAKENLAGADASQFNAPIAAGPVTGFNSDTD